MNNNPNPPEDYFAASIKRGMDILEANREEAEAAGHADHLEKYFTPRPYRVEARYIYLICLFLLICGIAYNVGAAWSLGYLLNPYLGFALFTLAAIFEAIKYKASESLFRRYSMGHGVKHHYVLLLTAVVICEVVINANAGRVISTLAAVTTVNNATGATTTDTAILKLTNTYSEINSNRGENKRLKEWKDNEKLDGIAEILSKLAETKAGEEARKGKAAHLIFEIADRVGGLFWLVGIAASLLVIVCNFFINRYRYKSWLELQSFAANDPNALSPTQQAHSQSTALSGIQEGDIWTIANRKMLFHRYKFWTEEELKQAVNNYTNKANASPNGTAPATRDIYIDLLKKIQQHGNP